GHINQKVGITANLVLKLAACRLGIAADIPVEATNSSGLLRHDILRFCVGSPNSDRGRTDNQTVEDQNRRREEDDVVVHRFGEMNSLSDDPIETSQSRDGDDDENGYYDHAEEPGRKMQELIHHLRTTFKRK